MNHREPIPCRHSYGCLNPTRCTLADECSLEPVTTGQFAPTPDFAGAVAYQLTKRLVIDMPTARAAVDAVLRTATAEPDALERAAQGKPPRLRNPGESTEDYRIAMGWDEPKSSPAVEKAMDRFYAAGPSRNALENCRLFAARHRKEEWAKTILKFCSEGGATGSPLRSAPPLSDEQVRSLWQTIDTGDIEDDVMAFARAVLAAASAKGVDRG